MSERLVYAIGDIHGRADLLEALVEKILNDALIHQNRNGAEHPAEVVFIGDVIDRGPNTSAVLEFMTAIAEWPEIEPIFILGNHEEMLLSFLKDPVRGKRWMRYGGYETLLSYNLALSGDVFEEDMLIRIAGELKQAMAVHLALLETFVPVHRNGNLYFVHAGANPAVSMDAQQQQDLVWGNDAFLRTPRRDGNWVIHGHTVVEKPSVKGGRIAIDTGAYLTGALTAVKVSASEISFLTETGARGLDGP
ncbi:MAG: metallophosphoesterase [Pseudomonadota bacterium]